MVKRIQVLRPEDVPYCKEVDIADIPNDRIDLECADGIVTLWMRNAIYLRVLWEPLLTRGIEVLMQDADPAWFPIKPNTCVKVLSRQYARLLVVIKGLDHIALMREYMTKIYELQYAAHAQLGAYVTSVDIIDLIKTLRSPELDGILRKPLHTERGVLYVEKELNRRGKKLMRLISTPGALTTNRIWSHAVSGAFKNDQFPQLCIAYGARSDITDEVLPHIITGSGVSGMGSLEDMVTESSSSKKSTYFNTTIICNAQTLHKVLKLSSESLVHRYEREDMCKHTPPTLKHIIRKGYSHNYVNKVCWYKKKKRVITKENHMEFADKEVSFISPIFCAAEDGVCVKCAGRAPNEEVLKSFPDEVWDFVWKYLPGIKLGKYVMSEIAKLLSQKVLSTKHIVAVILAILRLSKRASNFFCIDTIDDEDSERICIKFKEEIWEDYMDGYLAIPIDDVGHPKEILDTRLRAIEYGVFQKCGVVHTTSEQPKLFELGAESAKHCFTEEFFTYMRKHYSSIVCPPPGTRHKNVYLIPLHEWDVRKPIMETLDINEDMVVYVKMTESFFKTGIAGYENISAAVQGLTDFLYRKAEPNFFFIEIMFKAFVEGIANTDSTFVGAMKHIQRTNVGPRLALGYMLDYLKDPTTATKGHPRSDHDSLYGWLKKK